MKDRSSTTSVMHRGTIRNAGRGLLALLVLCLALGAIAAAAADRKTEAAGIKVMKDVSYGPHPRNVMDFQEKLRQAGGEATLLKMEGAGHGFVGNGSNKYAQETLTAALEFFTKHLTEPKARP